MKFPDRSDDYNEGFNAGVSFLQPELAVLKAQLRQREETETIYTVPQHVGRNIEVPMGSRVTFYDPGYESK